MKQFNNDLESKNAVHVTAYDRNTCTTESKVCKGEEKLCVANTYQFPSYAIRKKTMPMRLFFGLVLLLTVLNDLCGGSALLGSFGGGGGGGGSGSSELSTLITPHITPSALLQLATFHTLEEDAKEKHLNWGSSSVLQIRYDECNKEISRETKQFVRSILPSSSETVKTTTATVISNNMRSCNSVTISKSATELLLFSFSFSQENIEYEDESERTSCVTNSKEIDGRLHSPELLSEEESESKNEIVNEGEMQNKLSVNYHRRRPHRRQHRKRKTHNNNKKNNDISATTSAAIILKENFDKMEEKSTAALSCGGVVLADATTDETNSNYNLGLSSTTSLSTQIPPSSSFSIMSSPIEHKNINSATQVSTPRSFSYCSSSSSSSSSTYNMHSPNSTSVAQHSTYFVAQPQDTYTIPDFNIWHRIWCQMHIVEVACSTHNNNFIHLTQRFHEYQNMYPVVYHLHLNRFSHPMEEELLASSSCGLHQSRYWNCTQCHYAHSVVRESCVRCGAASHFTKLFVGNLLKGLKVTHATKHNKGMYNIDNTRWQNNRDNNNEDNKIEDWNEHNCNEYNDNNSMQKCNAELSFQEDLPTTFGERYANNAGQTKEQTIKLINKNENNANIEHTINENIDNYGLRVLLRILYATHPNVVIHRVEEHVKRTTSNLHENVNNNNAIHADTSQKGHDVNNANHNTLESAELLEINERSRGCASVYVKNEDVPILIDKLHHNIFINERTDTLPCKHATNDLYALENNGNINKNNKNNNSNELVAHYVYSSQQEWLKAFILHEVLNKLNRPRYLPCGALTVERSKNV